MEITAIGDTGQNALLLVAGEIRHAHGLVIVQPLLNMAKVVAPSVQPWR